MTAFAGDHASGARFRCVRKTTFQTGVSTVFVEYITSVLRLQHVRKTQNYRTSTECAFSGIKSCGMCNLSSFTRPHQFVTGSLHHSRWLHRVSVRIQNQQNLRTIENTLRCSLDKEKMPARQFLGICWAGAQRCNVLAIVVRLYDCIRRSVAILLHSRALKPSQTVFVVFSNLQSQGFIGNASPVCERL